MAVDSDATGMILTLALVGLCCPWKISFAIWASSWIYCSCWRNRRSHWTGGSYLALIFILLSLHVWLLQFVLHGAILMDHLETICTAFDYITHVNSDYISCQFCSPDLGDSGFRCFPVTGKEAQRWEFSVAVFFLYNNLSLKPRMAHIHLIYLEGFP